MRAYCVDVCAIAVGEDGDEGAFVGAEAFAGFVDDVDVGGGDDGGGDGGGGVVDWGWRLGVGLWGTGVEVGGLLGVGLGGWVVGGGVVVAGLLGWGVALGWVGLRRVLLGWWVLLWRVALRGVLLWRRVALLWRGIALLRRRVTLLGRVLLRGVLLWRIPGGGIGGGDAVGGGVALLGRGIPGGGRLVSEVLVLLVGHLAITWLQRVGFLGQCSGFRNSGMSWRWAMRFLSQIRSSR